MDPYDGLTDPKKINRDFLTEELGYLLPESEWEHLVWGRGAADQLSGVICQIIATKIMRELRSEGALHGVLVRSYGTVAEEDNDGGAPMYFMRKELAGAGPDRIPDVVNPYRGHGVRELGRRGPLPWPARAHANRSRSHRKELSRFDALGRSEPARVRR